MPLLIQNIKTNVILSINQNINLIDSVGGAFGYEDWFKIGSLEFFIQNYKKFIESENLNKNRDFGLNFNSNKTFKELKISY
tara:strand:- start:726 stop:968 length:243 start_codon:yes stop_codon:yes gene_type:complete